MNDARPAMPLQLERRRSTRWSMEKELTWRVFRGRRIRQGRLVERSLHGIVLYVDEASAQAGMRICLDGAEQIKRLGFHTVLVRRTEPATTGGQLVFAEIEA